MATISLIQTNFTSGVLDAKAAVREDIVFFYNGLLDASNVIGEPSGGIRRRGGTRRVLKIAPKLSQINLSGATLEAPQGGTAADAIDSDTETALETTGNIGMVNPYVVLAIDLLAARAVCAVDTVDIKLSDGFVAGEFRWQHSDDGASWSNIGPAIDVDELARSRRYRPTEPVTARYWRLARIGAAGDVTATISVAEVRLWEATVGLSNVKLSPFAYGTQEAYMTVASDRNLDILRGEDRVAACAIGHTSDHMAILNYAQRRDTLLLFHPDVRPPWILRQGDDTQFDFRPAPFKNIPQYDYGAGVGGTDEVQTINISGAVAATNKFTILLEGERTGTISGNTTPATVAANIETALRALPNTSDSGITVTDLPDNAGFEVTFGGEDGKQQWGLLEVSSLAGTVVMDVSRKTKGRDPGEDIMSDARGWPRCGCFYQGRLHLGGIRSREVENALLSSVNNDHFNFDIEQDDDEKALMTRADADQVSAIYQIVAGRHLSVFTSDSEFYVPQEPMTDSSVLKMTTRTGTKEGLRVYEVDGALLFGQGVKGDKDALEVCRSLREFLFIDTEQSYSANPLSKLAGHLIKNPVSQALRKAINTEDADILVMVNEDGTLTAFTTLRNDAVNAFLPLSTRAGDKFLDVSVDKKRRVYFVTERKINGQKVRAVEIWDDSMLLDGGGRVTITAETIEATEGQSVFAWTFDSPDDATAIGVRIDGARLGEGDYGVDLLAKTVTLSPAMIELVNEGSAVRIAHMVKVVDGVDYLEGEAVQTFVDGTQGPDVTIEDGQFALTEYADTEIQYGFDYRVYGKLMPFRVPESETLSGKKVRVVSTVLSLYNTGDIEIRANGGAWRSVALLQLDSEVLDRSTMEMLYSGEKIERGLLGFAVGGFVEFRQTQVAPLTLLAVTREVAV